MRILFDSRSTEFKSKFGTLRENEGCTFNIHVPRSIKTLDVFLVFNCECGRVHSAFSMYKTAEKGPYDVYSCDVSFAKSGLFFYYFIIKTENEEFSLFKQGYDMTNMEAGDYWQLSIIPEDFDVPEEFKGRVMYQIFPDRFYASGLCSVDGKLTPFSIHENKGDIPCFLPDERGIVQNNDFFGGNLRGITEKLDYLVSLNVGIIYLNPIFKAYSNHRYDTADYKRIDELLGTEEDFVKLCEEAHKRGIKIILDGVFSHTGSNSIYFDSEKVFGNGAVSAVESPYREWFDFKSYPDDYTSWWGIKTLPCVDENNEGYRDYIIRNEDSVIAHWLKCGADGFRLDVADELPDSFILELRNRMKGIKPDSLLIGEVWEDASNKSSYGVRRRYFTDGELDSVMNYPFRSAIIEYVLGNDTGVGFRNTVMTLAENYPECVLHSLMNILSTHDTVRILSSLGVDSVPADKRDRAVYRMNETQLKDAKDKLMCAAFLQFILPDSPCIYYGDEIGTEGFEDPFCRGYFRWDMTNDNDLLGFYRVLSRLKNEIEPLRLGDVRVTVVKEGTVRIDRAYKGKTVTAYVNMGGDYPVETADEYLLEHNIFCDGNKKFTKYCGFILFA